MINLSHSRGEYIAVLHTLQIPSGTVLVRCTIYFMKNTQSAGGVVVNPQGKILVVSQHGTSWSLPKGHLDPGELPLEAAVREIEEESGIKDVTFVKDLGSYERYKIGEFGGEDQSEKKTITMFLFTTKEITLKPIDRENPEARWVDKGEVEKLLTHPKDQEFFRTYSKTSK